MGHLMLKRRAQESFYVGPDVLITVVEVRGGAVRISVQAPDGVPVLRSELLVQESLAPSGEGEP